MFETLPRLGVGLGFREVFRSDVFRNQSQLDFLEITADHYLDASPAKEQELELLAQHFALIPHGLALSVGSADGLDDDYVRKLAALLNRLDPPWWSEHLGYTRIGSFDLGHFAPLPHTRAALEVVCRNVEAVQRRIDVPLVLENISYLVAMPGAEWSEADFLAEVLRRTGCGLLLDVMNLYANATNHGYDPQAFLQRIPPERVVQLHFTGGHWQDGTLVDSHSAPTPPAVWELLEMVLEWAPVKGVVLERDEDIPPFPELLAELVRARAVGRRCGRWA